jgi:hypothetical protein
MGGQQGTGGFFVGTAHHLLSKTTVTLISVIIGAKAKFGARQKVGVYCRPADKIARKSVLQRNP